LIRQVPVVVATMLDPVMLHVAVPPESNSKVNAPVPVPPVTVMGSAELTVPLVVVTVRVAWVPREIVTVVSADEREPYVESAAFVAVILHVPVEVVVNVEPLTEQPDAVPVPVTAYETAPEPEPPDVDNCVETPKTPVVDVTVNADWVTRETVKVTDVLADWSEATGAAVARTTQFPEPVKFNTAVVEFTVHVSVVWETTAYVIDAPPRAVARADGVAGESVVDNAVVGAHVTVCGARYRTTTIPLPPLPPWP
jgi:hypothetical protein